MVSEEEIAKILFEVESPEVACYQLVGEANEAGGKDNITAVIARYFAKDSQ
jgi:serine/threonine protein phosphatase PrpC